jgi:hypothetical protein
VGPARLRPHVSPEVGVAHGVGPRGGRRGSLAGEARAGYLLYGLVFTIHISTHNYYSLPLVPIVALSLGSVVDAATRPTRLTDVQSAAAVTFTALLVAGAVSWKLHGPLTDRSFGKEESVYVAAGRAADHTSRALYVDTHYADPERYYGWTAGTLLTSGYERHPADLARQALTTALRHRPKPTCAVLTGIKLRRQLAGFEAQLASRYAVVRRDPSFAIYDLSKPAGARADGC